MSIPADDLLLFARVMEGGSFSAAALRVGLPKSTVSRRISALEQAVGERLLMRTTRRLTLTDVGRGLLEHARRIASEVDEAEALASHRQERPSGRLRVSMPTDVATVLFGEAIARFVREHPAITLELDLSPRRVDLIAENVDLALRMGALGDDPQLSARRVAMFEGGLYASPDYLARHGHPRTPDDLLNHHGLMVRRQLGDARPWLLRGPNDENWEGLPASQTLANQLSMLLQLATEHAGIALVTHVYAREALNSGRLLRVLPQWHMQAETAWAVFPERRLMPARTRVFIDLLVEAAEAICARCPREIGETGEPPHISVPA